MNTSLDKIEKILNNTNTTLSELDNNEHKPNEIMNQTSQIKNQKVYNFSIEINDVEIPNIYSFNENEYVYSFLIYENEKFDSYKLLSSLNIFNLTVKYYDSNKNTNAIKLFYNCKIIQIEHPTLDKFDTSDLSYFIEFEAENKNFNIIV